MYATEKYVKLEVKELRELINTLAVDHGHDIQYIHNIVLEQQSTIKLLQEEVLRLREALGSKT